MVNPSQWIPKNNIHYKIDILHYQFILSGFVDGISDI